MEKKDGIVQPIESSLEFPSKIKAQLNYLAPIDEKPRTYAFDPPPGEPKSNYTSEAHEVDVLNGRPIAKLFSLDREGFAVDESKTAVKNFYDDDEVTRVYYPESERFFKNALNAKRVHIFDHTVRKRVDSASDKRGEGTRQPATRVHVDQTASSGIARVREHLPAEAEGLLAGRVQVINLWRPIVEPLLDAPLAMCDAQTVGEHDLVATDLIYLYRNGETYSVRFNPKHRWFYIPAMRTSEFLLLKCFGSKVDGRARFVPHTAFVDPTTPANAEPRESIELRALVFH